VSGVKGHHTCFVLPEPPNEEKSLLHLLPLVRHCVTVLGVNIGETPLNFKALNGLDVSRIKNQSSDSAEVKM